MMSQRHLRKLVAVTTILLSGCVNSGAVSATSKSESSVETFSRISAVLRSPRCLNCHPSGNAPRQGDERRVHDFRVVRGRDDRGAAGMRCATCHQESNQEHSAVPGAPHWQLAPASMGWEGLSDAELCRSLTRPQTNGGRSIEQVVQHMTDDPLVQWAWNPGAQRTLPPIAQQEFHELVRAWFRSGARCADAPD